MPGTALTTLPRSLPQALGRGMRGQCPRCGGAALFAGFLKPVERCPACAQDWTLHSADDFPPYVSILLTGHIMAPVIIALGLHTSLSAPAMMALVALMALVLLIGLLRPAKGGIIAFQWWMGMHGFAPRPGKREALGD
ncbi:DUF983 domain-containing protein [Novosphingobium sp. KCTC 2891]|uniref:DUF983 domain-containing protein n=1 Tax=Novosphingobium sp. KCTC 2891 TaxID=2989730 RepID=UPI0022237F95|nr:DUF983 domain-containing protein [Novosphingobium sp. KCTC 2891]MCW1383885.1 DUF983 domain-containing protein [Novosphingobium sp. KCTC 2891]